MDMFPSDPVIESVSVDRFKHALKTSLFQSVFADAAQLLLRSLCTLFGLPNMNDGAVKEVYLLLLLTRRNDAIRSKIFFHVSEKYTFRFQHCNQ